MPYLLEFVSETGSLTTGAFSTGNDTGTSTGAREGTARSTSEVDRKRIRL